MVECRYGQDAGTRHRGSCESSGGGKEKIGQELLAHVERLRNLRTDITSGIQSLDAGAGRELDTEELLRRAREQHGRG